MPNSQYSVEHESAFIQSFVIRERRARWMSSLSSSKHRRAFLDRLNHLFINDLDARYITHKSRQLPSDIDRCYIFADEAQYDGMFVTAVEAADALSSASFGIVVSFLPGRLACYKDEAPSELIWLR